jgi:flagellar biosynthesis chaperone FliJ
MDAHAAILVSLIQNLEQFERRLEGITASNHNQIAKAREYLDDSREQMMPQEARVRRNHSFLPSD